MELSKSLPTTLKQTSNTRWTSAFTMIKSVQENKQAITKNPENPFTEQDWKAIDFLFEILRFISISIRVLECDKTPTLN